MKSKPRWYRKWDLDVPKEVVKEVVARYGSSPEKYAHSRMAGPHTPPDTDFFVGKTLAFRSEERVFTFVFTALNELRFLEPGQEEKTCYCNVKTMDNEIFFVNFLVPGWECSRQISLIPDMKTGCATVCDAHIGTEYCNIDVDREFFFGRLDGVGEGGALHGFTDEIVGRAMLWEYAPDVMKIKHMYVSNLFYTYTAYTRFGAWMSTNPADYVKIRDNKYLFSFVEERQAGLQALFLIDFDACHDIGSFYGVGTDHITSACVGAKGEPADILTVY
jgi:hypothetical protein